MFNRKKLTFKQQKELDGFMDAIKEYCEPIDSKGRYKIKWDKVTHELGIKPNIKGVIKNVGKK